MAQIVLLDKSLRAGENAGDVISVHGDDVELSGAGYALARIVQVKGPTVEEVRAALLGPEIRPIWRSKAPANEWTTEQPEEKPVWIDGEDKKFLEKPPRHAVNLALSAEDLTALADAKTDKAATLALLAARKIENVRREIANDTKVTLATIADAK